MSLPLELAIVYAGYECWGFAGNSELQSWVKWSQNDKIKVPQTCRVLSAGGGLPSVLDRCRCYCCCCCELKERSMLSEWVRKREKEKKRRRRQSSDWVCDVRVCKTLCLHTVHGITPLAFSFSSLNWKRYLLLCKATSVHQSVAGKVINL